MNPREHLINESLQEKPRIPDEFMKDHPKYNPSTYVSIQDRVNNDPEYEKTYFSMLIDDGWMILENKEAILKPELRGHHFKYRLNGNSLSGAERGTFRSGGIILGMKDQNREYFLYKAYNGSIFPLQLSDIEEIYIKDPEKQIIKIPRPTEVTDYPVYVRDANKAYIIYNNH